MRQKIALESTTQQRFQTLVDDGTLNKVADAQMRGETLNLMHLLNNDRENASKRSKEEKVKISAVKP